MELWLPINDYENYSISTLGNVKNNKTGLLLHPTIKQITKINPYFKVNLTNDNGKKCFRIHRIVAQTFIINLDPSKNNQVDHIDRNKLNNNMNNLRWVSCLGNNINKPVRSHSETQIKGIQKHRNKWIACLSINNNKYIKSFYSLDNAINYRKELEIMYHTHISETIHS